MAEGATMLQPGAAVAVGERGILILGRSGAGKSTLMLRMMALGARLVADDQVAITRRGEQLIATAPPTLAGLIEARGIGFLRVAAAGPVPLMLAVDLDRPPEARLPHWRKIALLGLELDLISGQDVPHLGSILMVLAQNGRAID